AHTARGHTWFLAYDQTASLLGCAAAESCLGESLSRIVQPVASVSDGWRTRSAGSVFAAWRYGACDAARCPHRTRFFDSVHDGRNPPGQLVAGDDRVFPVRGRTT